MLRRVSASIWRRMGSIWSSEKQLRPGLCSSESRQMWTFKSRSSVTMRKTLPVPCHCSSFSVCLAVCCFVQSRSYLNWVQERKTYCLGSSLPGIEAGSNPAGAGAAAGYLASLPRIGDLYFNLGKTSLLQLPTNAELSERYRPDRITSIAPQQQKWNFIKAQINHTTNELFSLHHHRP